MQTRSTLHNYLTDDEVFFMRDQLKDLRKSGVSEPGKWFVSGLNRDPNAIGLALPKQMPKSVVIKDISLRVAQGALGRTRIDGEQQLVRLDLLPFLKMNFHDLAGDLRTHVDRRIGFHVADIAQFDRHIFSLRLRY